jgi:hypothetical protein
MYGFFIITINLLYCTLHLKNKLRDACIIFEIFTVYYIYEQDKKKKKKVKLYLSNIFDKGVE